MVTEAWVVSDADVPVIVTWVVPAPVMAATVRGSVELPHAVTRVGGSLGTTPRRWTCLTNFM